MAKDISLEDYAPMVDENNCLLYEEEYIFLRNKYGAYIEIFFVLKLHIYVYFSGRNSES